MSATVTGQIVALVPARSSVNGNPAFFVDFSNGMRYRTQSDSMIAYGIENSEYVGSAARGIPAPLVTLKLTRAGRVYGVTPVPQDNVTRGSITRCRECRFIQNGGPFHDEECSHNGPVS